MTLRDAVEQLSRTFPGQTVHLTAGAWFNHDDGTLRWEYTAAVFRPDCTLDARHTANTLDDLVVWWGGANDRRGDVDISEAATETSNPF